MQDILFREANELYRTFKYGNSVHFVKESQAPGECTFAIVLNATAPQLLDLATEEGARG